MAAVSSYFLDINSNDFFLIDNKKAFTLWLNVPKVTACQCNYDAKFMKSLMNKLVTLYEAIVVTCVVFLLGEPLYDKVFKNIWEFLSFQYSLAMICTVICLAIYCLRIGYKASLKYIDKTHWLICYSIFIVYVYYKFFFKCDSDDYSLINIVCKLDSFAIFFMALFVGFIIGKFFRYNKNTESNTEENKGIVPIYLDEPIVYENNDLLHYAELARSLSYSIRQKSFSNSYSIGINSPWGTGKSSFLNLLKLNLKKVSDVIVVDFNARASVNVNCIQMDFLSTLATSLSPFHTGMKSVMKDYMEDLSVLADDTSWGKFLGLINIKDATDSRARLQDGIEKINKKIVVFIDDLDRLTCEEILEVLKLITKNAAFVNTVFITAYDKDYINCILEKNLYVPQKQNFSDKYFCMEIALPEGNQQIRSTLLLKELTKLSQKGLITACKENDFQQSFMAISMYVERYLLSLRDVKRFLNTFCASYLPIQHEVYFEDVLMISLLRFARKELYDLIKSLECFDDPDNKSENVYVLKLKENIKFKDDYDAMRVLFPTRSNGNLKSLNEKGQKHIYWKRSFNTYFYNLEYTSFNQEDINKLLESNITDADIRSLAPSWKERKIEVDIKDFLVKIENYQNSQNQLKAYLKLCMICYRYTINREIFFLASRYLYYYQWSNLQKKFKFSSKDDYKQYVKDILMSEADINATSYYLHYLLLYQLSEMNIEEKDCVFTNNELKDICLERLKLGVKQLDEGGISASDVLYLGWACLQDANPSDLGQEGFVIMKESKEIIKDSIISTPKKYLYQAVDFIQKETGKIQFEVKQSSQLRDIFTTDELQNIIKEIDSQGNNTLEDACNFWSKYLDYCITQKTMNLLMDYKGDSNKVEKYNYKQYRKILEGETI